MHYTLRPATADDADYVSALHRATMKDYVAQTWGWDEDFQRQSFAQWFTPSQFQIIVVDGQSAGLLRVEHRQHEIFLATIMIHPDYQRHGLGASIIKAVLAEGAAGELPVTLTVLKVNPARQLYERLGFQVTGETTTHYQMRTINQPVIS